MVQDDSLRRAHLLERQEALLPAVSALLHAAERQLDPAARAVAVDEDLAAPYRLGDALLAAANVARNFDDDTTPLEMAKALIGLRLSAPV